PRGRIASTPDGAGSDGERNRPPRDQSTWSWTDQEPRARAVSAIARCRSPASRTDAGRRRRLDVTGQAHLAGLTERVLVLPEILLRQRIDMGSGALLRDTPDVPRTWM